MTAKITFRKTSVAVLLLLLALPSLSASADTEEVKWTRVNIPAQGGPGGWVMAKGSDILHLTGGTDGTLYAYGKGLTYTLYKSTDGGPSWAYPGNVRDSIVAIATTPGDASTLYYATASHIYRSGDGGKTFYQLPVSPGGAGSNNLAITSLAVARHGGNIIAAGIKDTDSAQYGGVYLLDETEAIPAWKDTGLTGLDVYALAFSPNYASDRQLITVATDETSTFVTSRIASTGWGATFGNARLNKDNTSTPAPVAVADSAAIAFPADYDAISGNATLFVAISTGSENGDVYRIDSVEGGVSKATDLNIGAAYGQSNTDITGLAVTGNTATARLLAGAAASAQVYSSADGGSNWTRSRKAPTGESKTFVLAAPGKNVAYAATSGKESAFSVSYDNGATWDQAGLIDTEISAIVDFAPSPDYSQNSTMFLLTFGGEHSLWRSRNGGNTWERTFNSTLPNVDSVDFVRLSPRHGQGSQVVYLAGSSNSQPAVWKSSNNGQSFTCYPAFDPAINTPLTVSAMTVISDTAFFIGSYDGGSGRVYLTTSGGLSYSSGATVGSQTPVSIALSPDYERDGTLLVGSAGGWVYLSQDKGASFTSLPASATSPPLTGNIMVAFNVAFSSNRTVYAASSTAGKGMYRFTLGTGTDWTSVDSTLPAGSLLNQLQVSSSGTLYSANAKAGGGMERCLNPTHAPTPTFETVTRGLSANATLSGLWQYEQRLWSIDTTNNSLLTFIDSLTMPVNLTSPVDKAPGVGALINNSVSNIYLDWKPVKGATGYQWQLSHNTDFSSLPTGSEGTTAATSVRLPALEPAATYYWRVRANEPVLSPWSEKWTFNTCLNTVSSALKLESPEAGATSVPVKPLFQWQAVAGASAYEILISNGADFASPVVARTGNYALPGTAWECDVLLEYNATYYWKVRGISASSSSGWSGVGVFTTEQAPKPLATEPPVLPPSPSPVSLLTPVPSQPHPPGPSTDTSEAPPVPPAPTSPFSGVPGWIVYLIGALLAIIVLLLVIILVLVAGIRRSY